MKVQQAAETIAEWMLTSTVADMTPNAIELTEELITRLIDESVAEAVKPYKDALSSGMCSKHQEPQPLTCKTCNKVAWLDDLEAVIEMNEKRIAEIEGMLDDADDFGSDCRRYSNRSLRELANCNCWVCRWRKMKEGVK